MLAVALRYAETFAPECGTVLAHEKIINEKGYVWYGKIGLPLSDKVIAKLLSENVPRLLLIQSGGTHRHWAYISEVRKQKPLEEGIPQYYGDLVEKVKTWFIVVRFEEASKDVMARCRVIETASNPQQYWGE